MKLSDLHKLTERYENELNRKLELSRILANAKGERDALVGIALNQAYENGVIDGKNKQIRDAQEADLLAKDEGLKSFDSKMSDMQSEFDRTSARVSAIEAEIGLTKAWLYSQASIG